jgi:hypothetical protein
MTIALLVQRMGLILAELVEIGSTEPVLRGKVLLPLSL